jgi:hypothetical protein
VWIANVRDDRSGLGVEAQPVKEVVGGLYRHGDCGMNKKTASGSRGSIGRYSVASSGWIRPHEVVGTFDGQHGSFAYPRPLKGGVAG